MKKIFLNFLKKNGYEFRRINDDDFYPREASRNDREIIDYVLGLKSKKYDNKLTMISPKCLWAAISSVKYCLDHNINGDIVECGVWKGGCSIAMALDMNFLLQAGIHIVPICAPISISVSKLKFSFLLLIILNNLSKSVIQKPCLSIL